MRYLLLIHNEPAKDSDAALPEYMRFTEEIRASGELLGGDRLHGVETATSVRVRDGRMAITDGPFAETREHLGGYFVVEVKDLDRAIELAAKIPAARTGVVEVRPVMDMPELF